MKEFGIHPSEKLQKLFEQKPYQGQNPEKASILFLSSDANFDKNIESMPIFPKIEEYLKDGVSFWKKYSIHHPFMLPEYKGDGKKFHEKFSNFNLDKSYADRISFIELFEKPTYGKKDDLQLSKLFNKEHWKKLENWIFNSSQEKIVFIATGVYNKIKISEFKTVFTELDRVKAEENQVPLQFLYKNKNLKIYAITHFSNAISSAHLKEIEKNIKLF